MASRKTLKRKSILPFATVLFLTASLVLLVSCTDRTPPSRKTNEAETTIVTLGFSGPLTGSMAHVGQDYRNGLLMAIQDLNNQHNKLNGKNLFFRLLSEDDAGDPRTATLSASLLSDKKIIAVIGHVDSGCTIAASSIYNKAGIIQIAPSVSNQKYTEQGFDNTFRMMAPDNVQGRILGDYISKLKQHPKVALIDDGSAYGQNLSNQVENMLKKKNIPIAGREYTYRNNLDYTAILAQINKTGANILFFSGTDVQAAHLIKQERALNQNIIFITGDMACTPRFLSLAEENAERTICSRNSPPLDHLKRVIYFKNRYEKRFSVPMQPYALFSYDAAMLVSHAIKTIKTLDKRKIIHYLHNSQYTGLTGLISFSEKGDPKIPYVTLFRISKGKFVMIKTYSHDPFSCVHNSSSEKQEKL